MTDRAQIAALGAQNRTTIERQRYTIHIQDLRIKLLTELPRAALLGLPGWREDAERETRV